MGYPNGTANIGNSGDLPRTAQVLVVGTTGYVNRTRAAIRTVFAGNLCVVHATHPPQRSRTNMTCWPERLVANRRRCS